MIPSGEQNRERSAAFCNKISQKGEEYTPSDAAIRQAGAEEGVESAAIGAIMGLAAICTHTHCDERSQHGEQVCVDCYGLTSEFCSSQGGHCQPGRQNSTVPDGTTRHEGPEKDDDQDKRRETRETVTKGQSSLLTTKGLCSSWMRQPAQ